MPDVRTDPLSAEDLQRDKERANAFWAVTFLLFVVLQAAHPPTVALGAAAGWIITGATGLLTIGYVVRLNRAGAAVSERELQWSSIVGAISIGLAEWLGGGAETQLHLLFTLTVLGCSAILTRPVLLRYLAVLSPIVLAPIVYDHAGIVELVVFLALLWIEGLLVGEFGDQVREQRAQLYEAERAAAGQARTDALTGLANRRALELALDDRPTTPQTVVFLDLNGFKTYNDRFGHGAGDALLQRLGRALDAVTGDLGRAFRLGGDEFCVLLDGEAQPGSRAVAKIVAALTEKGPGFAIDPSCGVVVMPREAADPDTALRLADERMYADKRGGRTSPAQEMSELLLRVVAAREPDLHDHAVDVVDLARAVARHVGATAEEIDLVVRAAEQHDVGKLAIPDAVLQKPGPLDDAEWQLMRQHTIIGERILSGSPALRPVARLVRSSHEFWDGGGYPDGLAGEAIPLGARIVGVCDAFSAMVADRPYRTAMTREDAVAELRRCAGTQFDPTVTEALAAVVAAAVPA